MVEYFKLIKEIAKELKIEVTFLSDDFIIELKKNNVRNYLYGYKFPLNNHGIGLIMDDKLAFFEVLKNLNLKTLEFKAVNLNYDKEDLSKYLHQNKQLVLKANNGTCGTEVFKITNETELFTQIDFLLNKNSPVCLMPYYEIQEEYRVILLNKEVKLIYGKRKPIIIGDGKSTILTLLKKFNSNYYSKKSNYQKLNFDLNKVLKSGEQLEIDFRYNLSRGANIFIPEDEFIIKKLKDLAFLVVKNLDICFASIDIVRVNNEFYILEANSGIMMDNFIKLHKNGYNIAKDIYKEAILLLFAK